MGKNSRMRTGRPKLPPDEVRKTDIKIPLSEAEKELIKLAASVDDEKPVTWSRKIIMDAAKRRAKNSGAAGNRTRASAMRMPRNTTLL